MQRSIVDPKSLINLEQILGTMTDSIYTGDDFAEKVKKQVEFYFSDSNLQTDKFLWRIYEANDGWVELKTILTFGRMRQYRPEEKVIEALKTSDKLTLSPNEDMVRRSAPLKDYNELKNIRRRNSVHIEGFPNDLTQEALEEWFTTKIIPNLPKEKNVCSIRRIRNRATKEFFGVVDVEFRTQEDSEFFLGVSVSYPRGIVKDEEVDEKDRLKKMSLLTFREMRESGKRFGVNEVTKRRNSFKDNNRKKFRKGGKRDDKALKEDVKEAKEDSKVESKEDESHTKENMEPSTEKKEITQQTKEGSDDTKEVKEEAKVEANAQLEGSVYKEI